MCDLQLDYICTYKLIVEDGEDEFGLKEGLYQLQLLQMFSMTEFYENKLNDKIDELYNIIKNEYFIQIIFDNHPYKDTFLDDLIFRTLFSYDYFDLFHKCLHAYFNKKPYDLILDELIKSFTSK